MPLPAAAKLVLTESEVRQLQAISRHRNTPPATVLRVKILLGAAQGLSNRALARNLATSVPTVLLWRRRFEEEGLSGILEDRHRSGRPKQITREQESTLIEATVNTRPKDDPCWTVRAMAASQEVSPATVQRIWKKFKVNPRRVPSIRFFADSGLTSRVRGIVGLYLHPPERAIVFSADEQIYQLEQTRLIHLLRPGSRHMTSRALAALRALDRTIAATCPSRRQQHDFLDFLERIDDLNPKAQELHLALENTRVCRCAKVKGWLQERPRYHLHFTPSGSSWLKYIESLLAEALTRQLCRMELSSIRDLVDTSKDFVGKYHRKPEPFRWLLQSPAGCAER